MYLSRIPLNPHRRGGRSLMGSPQTMHAAVLAAFPDSGESRGRVLWRLDRDQHNTWLYVVSRPLPDFSHIVEQAGWETPEGQSLIKSYEPLLDRLKNNQQWAFRVTVNPTVTHDKRRYGHV
ncbi:MAG: type I-E CRISPR-associated protein Cas6/Cse3/CasE, partial [Propionibacteriaceae bacterium]|nr:type I-E CRISPR-associated protein Cas6/Cse3/CasE [Propionibacteriaceae bacterium]